MNTSAKAIIALLSILAIASCSRKKDKFLNRNFHAMGSYYNIIYNGNLALEEGKLELQQDYKDHYWDILPIERMKISENISMGNLGDNNTKEGEGEGSKFQRAEEKAAKAIQKHNMLIDGQEHNPQMDEAFILLGKSRYYDQRFIPALEAFNYVLRKHNNSNKLFSAMVWREKTNMRLGYNELALKNLKTLLYHEDAELEKQDYADAAAAMAQAYLNLEQQDSAIFPLDTAIAYTKSKDELGRYLFIKAQIQERLGRIDSAHKTFDKIIALNRKIPRTYLINAHLEKIKTIDSLNGDKQAQLTLLTELADNRENRPFLDRIYYQTANFYHRNDSINQAIVFYNKSLREESIDTFLVSRNYLNLGNIYFDDAQYKTAGAYYDSTLTYLFQNSREYRAIKKKRENLDDVILYETIAVKNDSILQLVNMPAAEKEAYFKNYADSLKSAAITAAKNSFKQPQNTNGNFFGKQQSIAGGPNAGNNYYFYNTMQVANGIRTFKKTWGNIALEDNWRFNPKKERKKNNTEDLSEKALIAQIENDPQYNPQNFIDQLPKEQSLIDSLSTERNFAYYQLGIIYKEKFKEYGLASDKLEKLLKNSPEERLILPSKYNLYKIYEATGNTTKANYWKQNIIDNHPETRYAKILKNPKAFEGDKDSPEAIYTMVYRKFEAQQYQAVLDDCNMYIDRFTGTDIIPKFELLKAICSGRFLGLESFKKGLNYVALNYPQSEEGKHAEHLVKTLIPELEKQTYITPQKDYNNYKLIYDFDKNKQEEAITLQEDINTALKELGYASSFKTSIDNFSPTKVFVVIHGLQSSLGAQGLAEQLSEPNKKQQWKAIKQPSFPIAANNYKTLLTKKNLNDYLEFLNKL